MKHGYYNEDLVTNLGIILKQRGKLVEAESLFKCTEEKH